MQAAREFNREHRGLTFALRFYFCRVLVIMMDCDAHLKMSGPSFKFYTYFLREPLPRGTKKLIVRGCGWWYGILDGDHITGAYAQSTSAFFGIENL